MEGRVRRGNDQHTRTAPGTEEWNDERLCEDDAHPGRVRAPGRHGSCRGDVPIRGTPAADAHRECGSGPRHDQPPHLRPLRRASRAAGSTTASGRRAQRARGACATTSCRRSSAIKVPNLRWPGGCFADYYHWKDGIGPREQRPSVVNNNWGGVTEDNGVGTHEFLELTREARRRAVHRRQRRQRHACRRCRSGGST